MNNEIFFGIVAFLLVWEVIFIIWMRYNKKHEDKDYLSKPEFVINTDEWGFTKLISFLVAIMFFMLHMAIIGFENRNYINLLWEFLIIVFIVIFCYINKLVVGLMNNKKPKKKGKKKYKKDGYNSKEFEALLKK